MKNYILVGFIVTAFFTSCTNDKIPKPASVCDTMTVSYLTMIKPIVDTKCAISSCHVSGSNGNGFDFSTYSGLKAEVLNNNLQGRVVEGNPTYMPPSPSPPLSQEEKQKFDCWIKAGGLQN